jgi:N-acetylglucosamine-6-phosphate deacetylase
MDRLFRAVASDAGDAGLAVAAAMTAATPARALGLERVGVLAAGHDANLVVLDDALDVVAVMLHGGWVVAD